MEDAVADEKQGAPNGEDSAVETAAPADERPVGQLLVEARTRRGLSADDVKSQTRIPTLYLKAIETDNYGLISDQLYLLPFLRRYASFVGLDPEDVASRFIRDVQRAETNVVRISEPISMITSRKRRPLRALLIGVIFVAGVAVLVLLALAKLGMLRTGAIPGLGSLRGVRPVASLPAASARVTPEASSGGKPLVTSIRPAAPAAATGVAARQAGSAQSAPARPSN